MANKYDVGTELHQLNKTLRMMYSFMQKQSNLRDEPLKEYDDELRRDCALRNQFDKNATCKNCTEYQTCLEELKKGEE